MDEPLKVVVVTQQDHLVIPRNVDKIAREEGIILKAVVILDIRGALANKKTYFAKGFGVSQTVRMGFCLARARFSGMLYRLFPKRWKYRATDLRSVALRNQAIFRRTQKLHDSDTISFLRELKPDVIVSFSAPCVFKKSILEIPAHGCINLHCSLLPRYAGLLPSFWVLYYKEKTAGATVHFMDDRIDNGAILGQQEVSVGDDATMTDVIRKTKEAGGELMLEVLRKIQSGTLEPKVNPVGEGSYFSWPTIEQMREFRRRGGRLI